MEREELVILKQQLASYLDNPVVFPAPERKHFAIVTFKNFKGAVKMLLHGYQNRALLKAEHFYNEGVKSHSLGLYHDAERAYGQCLALQPDHEPAHTNLAALLIRQNSFDLAQQQINEAIGIRPRFYRGYYNLGLLQRFMNDTEGARANFEKALHLNKHHFWSHVALAELYLAEEKVEQAVDSYHQSLACTSDPYPIHLRLADIFLARGEYPKAEEVLRHALERRQEPISLYNLGWVLAVTGKSHQECIDCFRDAEKDRVDFKEALFNLAMTQSLYGSGQLSVKNMLRYARDQGAASYTDNIAYLEKLTLVNPGNHSAHLKIAQIYLEQQLSQKAIETLLQVLKIDPQCVPALLALANSYHDLGRYKEAIQGFRKMIKIAPEEIEGYLGLTRAYGAIENYKAALPVIEKVLAMDPNNAEINYLYGTLMAQEGELEVAYRHYKRVASLNPDFPRIQKRLKMLEEELEDDDEPELWARPV